MSFNRDAVELYVCWGSLFIPILLFLGGFVAKLSSVALVQRVFLLKTAKAKDK